MTSKEIHYLTGLSVSLINKVRSGNTKGLSEATVNRVNFLLPLEVNYFDALFARADFGDICLKVIKTCTKRDHKNIANIIRFADKCYRRHNSLRQEYKIPGITDDDFNAAELMGIYLAEVKVMFKDPLFYELMTVALEKITKDFELRCYASFLLDISDMLNDLHKKQKEESE